MPGLVENSQVGKREDLSDIYSIADAKETPFISRVKKGSAPRNSEFDWLVDNYDSVSTAGVVDGTDVSSYENHADGRARLGNCVQVWRKASKVSRLAEELSVVAGVPSEIKLAVVKKLVELKRNMEATLLSSNAAQVDNGSVEYKTAGLGLWIDTTGPTVPRAVPAAYATPTASINTTATASLAEPDIQAVMTSIYNQTGMNGDYLWLMGTTLRRRVTEMTRFDDGGSSDGAPRVRNFNQASTDTTITSTTEVYKGDYGKLSVVTSLFIGGDTYDIDRGYVLNMDGIEFKSLVKPRAEYFEDQGGGKRFLLEAVGGLQVNNPLQHGKFQP
jgi:hypothetical protein